LKLKTVETSHSLLTDNLHNWLQRLERMQPDKIELGLGRIKQVAASLGIDTPNFRIITVAGTNGKGSTVAFADAMLRHCGYSTGVYTSPHFIHFSERIVVKGRRADDDMLCRSFEAIDKARGEVALTYFEFTTLAAIWCFIDANIERPMPGIVKSPVLVLSVLITQTGLVMTESPLARRKPA